MNLFSTFIHDGYQGQVRFLSWLPFCKVMMTIFVNQDFRHLSTS